ncbi:hypothetical protein [Candidatus Symbiopectobacterium sp.]|nr:hypothetical protein [Candidatus Symbiopectobacterium sp.]
MEKQHDYLLFNKARVRMLSLAQYTLLRLRYAIGISSSGLM